MNVYFLRTFAAVLISLLALISFTWWNLANRPYAQYAFPVSIPKAYDPNFTDQECIEFFLNRNQIPISEIKRRNLQLPNIGGILVVSLEKNGKLTINSQQIGGLENTIPLTQKLVETFENRERDGIFERNSIKIAKTVIVKGTLSTRYGDVAKVVDAVKTSGADPIVLQIDDLTK